MPYHPRWNSAARAVAMAWAVALFAAHRVQHANGRVTIDGMEQEVPRQI